MAVWLVYCLWWLSIGFVPGGRVVPMVVRLSNDLVLGGLMRAWLLLDLL